MALLLLLFSGVGLVDWKSWGEAADSRGERMIGSVAMLLLAGTEAGGETEEAIDETLNGEQFEEWLFL